MNWGRMEVYLLVGWKMSVPAERRGNELLAMWKNSKADAKVRLIEETIEEFLESKEIQQKIGGDPYVIIIRDKEQNKIN